MARLSVAMFVMVFASSALAQNFETPVYFNFGGPEVVDSAGRVWLGDGAAAEDPHGIRPDDAGGANVIPGWCNPAAATIEALEIGLPENGCPGFDPATDATMFRSIRYDLGVAAGDYVLEVPVDAGTYTVDLFFCEACCPQRHFSVSVQGGGQFPDVSNGFYAAGATHTPSRLSVTDIVVEEGGVVRVELLPCEEPDCPGGTDPNPILSAMAIIPTEYECPCIACPSALECAIDVDTGTVTGTWTPPTCGDTEGYELWGDGELLDTLAGNATSFTVAQTRRAVRYTVRPLTADEIECNDLVCDITNPSAVFDVPLRINTGGTRTVDSRGQVWLGDPGAGADLLEIRPDDIGGVNSLPLWCLAASQSNASLAALGYDPLSLDDQNIFNTIRWDVGDDDGDLIVGELAEAEAGDELGGDIDFHMALPIANGDYQVGLYFNECCCPFRHFQIEIEGEILDDDVSVADYAFGLTGRTGRLAFDDIAVADGSLDIVLRPCPDCECLACAPGQAMDTNAICNAIEVLPAGSGAPQCPSLLTCELGEDGIVTGTWDAAIDVEPDGYELWVDGELVETLPGDSFGFTHDPGCQRFTHYDVVILSDDEDFLCPGLTMSCSVLNLDCPFASLVCINMGGAEAVDSTGQRWIGDPGQGLDTLDIRPNDAGGANAAVNWGIGNLKPESLPALGFDPDSAVDRSLISTIRWDPAVDGIDYRLQLPVENGLWAVTLILSENFAIPPTNRAMRLEVQGELIDDHFDAADFSPDPTEPGWAGSVTLEDVPVTEGILEIALLPCGCGAPDENAILNLLKVERTGDIESPIRFIRGDCNGDGAVVGQVGDAVYTLNFNFLGGAPPPCMAACDSNGDGAVVGQVGDAVYTLNFNFLGGPEPLAPFPACGVSEMASDVDLGCAEPPASCQ